MIMSKEELMEAVYAIELDMFENVHHVNGKDLCQSERDTFCIMRLSNLKTWPEELLASYLYDLESAKALGFNLMSEKYARMMESTYPEEYGKIKDCLPELTDAKKKRIEQLVHVLLDWESEIRHRYPFLDHRGRPLDSKQDSVVMTSFETYTRGELSVWSMNTLELYLNHCETLINQGINGSEEIYKNVVAMYGYPSLEAAAEKFDGLIV